MVMEQWLIIGISGVTCGGKTTLASSLYKYFKEKSGHEVKTGIEINRVELINQDNFFREIDDPKHQKIEKLNHFNWEIIESINTDKMVIKILQILGHKFVLYNTQSSNRLATIDHENLFAHNYAASSLRQNEDELVMSNDTNEYNSKHVKQRVVLNILVIEGFLIFNHPVTLDFCNAKFHLHVPYEICHQRRLNRVYNPPDPLGYFEMVVWPSYEKHLREFKDRDDIIFLNGAAPPEKCFQFVLKSLIEEL